MSCAIDGSARSVDRDSWSCWAIDGSVVSATIDRSHSAIYG